MPKAAKKPEPERQQISVWVMSDDLQRADALVAKVGSDRDNAGVGKVTRSSVLRLALMRGLDALEKEYR
jgi:hypothetical protein